jgi:hypothetical protein
VSLINPSDLGATRGVGGRAERARYSATVRYTYAIGGSRALSRCYIEIAINAKTTGPVRCALRVACACRCTRAPVEPRAARVPRAGRSRTRAGPARGGPGKREKVKGIDCYWYNTLIGIGNHYAYARAVEAEARGGTVVGQRYGCKPLYG